MQARFIYTHQRCKKVDETDQIMNLIGSDKKMINLGVLVGGKLGSGATLFASDEDILNLKAEDIIAALNREKALIR